MQRAWRSFCLATNLSGLLLLVTALPMVGWLIFNRALEPVALFVACLPLAMASLGTSFLSTLLPSLVGDGTVRFPLNFSLPAVFTSLAAVSSRLMSVYLPSIALIADAPRFDLVWGTPLVTVGAFGVQTATLSVMAFVQRRRHGGPS